jgi:hypothetical protein
MFPEELQDKLAQSKVQQVEVAEVREAIEKLISELVEQKAEKGVEVKFGDKPISFTLVGPEGIRGRESIIWLMEDSGKSLADG